MIWQVGLYAAAVLIPLVAFAIEAIFIRQLKRWNAYLATGAIGLSCVLSLIGFVDYTIESKFYAHAGEHSASAQNTVRPPSTAPPRNPNSSPTTRLVEQFRLGGAGRNRSAARARGTPGYCHRQPDRRSCSSWSRSSRP